MFLGNLLNAAKVAEASAGMFCVELFVKVKLVTTLSNLTSPATGVKLSYVPGVAPLLRISNSKSGPEGFTIKLPKASVTVLPGTCVELLIVLSVLILSLAVVSTIIEPLAKPLTAT